MVTDHLMPGMTGAQFVRELRKVEETMPVLVVSGLDEAESEYAGLNVMFRLKLCSRTTCWAVCGS